MGKIPSLQDLKKKPRKRFAVFSVFAIAFLLTDEAVKEGYAFSGEDVLIPLTHEFFIMVLLILNVLLTVVNKVKIR